MLSQTLNEKNRVHVLCQTIKSKVGRLRFKSNDDRYILRRAGSNRTEVEQFQAKLRLSFLAGSS